MSEPFVSVIMPVRNEEDFIARSVGGALRQDYPPDRFEVIVVDGHSEDGTARIVRDSFRDAAPAALLIDNPRRIVPVSLNLGLRRARGDVVVRIDGHCEVPRNYLARCVDLLRESGADCVGGRLETIGSGPTAEVIAAAQGSAFGVGGVAFRTGARGGYVDTLAFGAYKRVVFERIGGFDEDLVRNQDDEFNFRLRQSGGTIWLDPDLVSRYYSRATFRSLWKQYQEYGLYKVLVIQKRGAVPSLRHLAPVAFLIGLAGSIPTSILLGAPWPILLVGGAWLMAALASGIAAARRRPRLVPPLLLAYANLHLAYGVGFLRGLLRWRRWKRSAAYEGATKASA